MSDAGNAGGAVAAALRRCAVALGAAVRRLTRPAQIYPDTPLLGDPRRLAMIAVATGVVFVIGIVFVDAAVIRAVQGLPRPVMWFFNEITDFGKSGWFLWPLGLLFLALAALPRHITRMSQAVQAALMVRVGFLFVAIGAPGLFVTIVKRAIGRARPLIGGALDPFLFDPFRWTAAYASLPSGHATTAFSVLAAFSSLWPRGRTMLLIYAVLIAASRIIVTAHYPTDVLAGALVGLTGVLIVRRYFAARRIGFGLTPNGTVTCFPGPSIRRIKSLGRDLLSD